MLLPMGTQTDNVPVDKEPDQDFLLLRRCIQKVATGPEFSKDLDFDEAYAATQAILQSDADPVQSAVFLIALRMKRETDDETSGILKAIIDSNPQAVAEVDHLIDVADMYDGYTRSVPMAPFVPAVLAACGLPAVSHGVRFVGPKFGLTAHKLFALAGIATELSVVNACRQIANPDIGWAYIDQKNFCPQLHNLVPLRARIVKRPVLTTVEVLANPIRARKQTHILTGYVHKAYPSVYAHLARVAGFDSAMIVRGVEGGVIPSLKQAANLFEYYDQENETLREVIPQQAGIEQTTRAVPIPKNIPSANQTGDEVAADIDTNALAEVCLETGLAALRGTQGAAFDALVYAGAIVLTHLQHNVSLSEAADRVRRKIFSGAALEKFNAAIIR